jgi:hypothetical protein
LKLIGQPGMSTAMALAVLMHVFLFTAAKPSNGNGGIAEYLPPATYYGMLSEGNGVDMTMVRTVRSPTVFSLPSEMGFSRELQQHNVQNRKILTPVPVRSERFHEVAFGAGHRGGFLDPKKLMINSSMHSPGLPPSRHIHEPMKRPAKRVHLSPELSGRLMGGVVLPPDLNQPVEKPWIINASISVSEQGAVEHVFLDQPIEPGPINQQVLQVLYSLRFKPGAPVEGSIKIYSSETVGRPGEAE